MCCVLTEMVQCGFQGTGLEMKTDTYGQTHTRTHRTQMFDAQRTQIAEALMHMGSFATIAKCSIFLSLQQLV